MRRIPGWAQAALVALGMLAVAGGPLAPRAFGACESQPPIEDAVRSGDIVFVGTVTFLENDNRWAVATVDERWRGADGLGPTVQVHGGPEPGTRTPVDRTYEPVRYLFVASDAGGGVLSDNACSGTQPWTEDLARLRPGGVDAVAPGATGSPLDVLADPDVVTIAALVGALLVAVLAYILILRSRRRGPDWRR